MLTWINNHGVIILNGEKFSYSQTPLYTQSDINKELKDFNEEFGTDWLVNDYRDEYFVECAIDERGKSYFRKARDSGV